MKNVKQLLVEIYSLLHDTRDIMLTLDDKISIDQAKVIRAALQSASGKMQTVCGLLAGAEQPKTGEVE